MRAHRPAVACLAFLVGTLSTSCGADPTSEPVDVDESAATAALAVDGQALALSEWDAALPADLVNVELGDAVRIGSCRYTVGTAEDPAAFGPPTYVVFLAREPARANADCEAGFVLLGTSTIRPQTVIDAHRGRGGAVVVAFTQKDTFSGAGFVRTEIVHVSPDTGVVLHATELAALPPFGTGTVVPTDVSLRGNGTLVVTGTKNGVIPGETGAGSSFIAVYESFLFDEDPTPVPTHVAAF